MNFVNIHKLGAETVTIVLKSLLGALIKVEGFILLFYT